MVKRFKKFNEAIDFSKWGKKSDKELTDKFNKLQDKEEKEEKKSENPSIDDLIAKYSDKLEKDKEGESAKKVYNAYKKRGGNSGGIIDFSKSGTLSTSDTSKISDDVIDFSKSGTLSTSDTWSSTELIDDSTELPDDEVAALIDDKINARRKEKEKPEERTKKLPKLKYHFIIKDDINEFYFVDDIAKTLCGANDNLSKIFKNFKTDEDGRVLAYCTNCKNKGLLLDHISEIKYFDSNK